MAESAITVNHENYVLALLDSQPSPEQAVRVISQSSQQAG
jgi:hypothetical protein